MSYLTRCVAVRTIGALVVAGAGVLALAGPAAPASPDDVAWWNVANRGGGAPSPPPPPDVKEGDVFVEGSRAGPGVEAAGTAPSSAQAVGGLAFEVPHGALVGSLTLHIRGNPPASSSVTACRTTSDFVSESNGAWGDVPPYDCSGEVAGKVTGDALVFDNIGTLVRGSRLSFVLLPGSADRLVLRKPGADALQMTGSGSSGPPPLSAPPAAPGGAAAQQSGGVPVSGSSVGGVEPSGSGGGGFGGPAAMSGPPGAPMSGPVGQPPQVAAAGTNRSAPATAPVAARPLLATNWQRIAACLLIAAEVAGFMLLQRRRTPARAVSMPVLGGRLRPPDVAGGQSALANRGVGRFTRDRERPASRL